MIVKYLLTVILVFLFTTCGNKDKTTPEPEAVIDDLGNVFYFDKPPERIITLAPNLTEFIFDIGIEDKLIGNTLFCDYPEQAKNIEKVGDLLTFNFEKILQLKPDLIFITVEGNTKETYDKFKELGLKIFVSNPRGYNGIKKTYYDICKIFQMKKRAEEKIAEWDSTISKIKSDTKKYKPYSFFCTVELKPIIAVGKNTFINEIIELCGGKNILTDSIQNYPILSREKILQSNPDYFLYITNPNDSIDNIIKVNPEWKSLNAVKNKKVLILDRNLFGRPGPRFLEAVKTLFTLLHPEG